MTRYHLLHATALALAIIGGAFEAASDVTLLLAYAARERARGR